jgi:tetratricopeptide (TPR) repeat protein
MVSKKIEDTQPIKINSLEESAENNPVPADLSDTQSIQIKPKRWKTIILGMLLILLFAIGGGGIGYFSGIQKRVSQENEEVITQAATHYQYGIQELETGNYELARVQFEYVLQIYPEFPGIMEKYTEVMVKLGNASIPSEQVIQPAPTTDTRGAEALFNQVLQEIQTQQWSLAIQSLEALRNEDYTYRTVEVDGMYFTALRYRAVEMIVNEGNLEEGLYFLALLEKYAPLDHDAVNYASWARLYIIGASYWEIDWPQVVNYFGQLAAAFPYLHDGTGWTATDRYLKGSEFYGDLLASEGKHCDAILQYQNILNYSALDHIQVKYDQSYILCYPPTAVPQPTETESPEATPTETPEAAPTETSPGD